MSLTPTEDCQYLLLVFNPGEQLFIVSSRSIWWRSSKNELIVMPREEDCILTVKDPVGNPLACITGDYVMVGEKVYSWDACLKLPRRLQVVSPHKQKYLLKAFSLYASSFDTAAEKGEKLTLLGKPLTVKNFGKEFTAEELQTLARLEAAARNREREAKLRAEAAAAEAAGQVDFDFYDDFDSPTF